MEKEHYYWLDNIKVFACLLVVLGHFFQSLTKSNILPADSLYEWFNETIYYFHVPLFFVCSGFLYQKFSKVYDLKSWVQNVIKKAVDLGVPYFSFSMATWILKTVFSGQTNSEVGGLFESLFIKPISPYWFLYCLFLIFMITPTFNTSSMGLYALIIAVGLRLFSIHGGQFLCNIIITIERDLVCYRNVHGICTD